MMTEDLAERLAEYIAFNRERECERKAREQHRRAEDKKLRHLIRDHGLLETLRQVGIESLDKKAQYRIARQVQGLTHSRTPFVYEPASVDRRSKLSKLRRLAGDHGATEGERQAALAAIESLHAAARPEQQATAP